MRTPGISGTLAFNEGVSTGPFYGLFSPINTNASTGAITGLPTDGFNTGADSVLFLTGAQSGGVNYNLPTVAAIFASLVGYGPIDIIGASWKIRIINNATTQTITVAATAGWTLGSGTNSMANNSYRDFVVNITSQTTATMTEIGSGTYP